MYGIVKPRRTIMTKRDLTMQKRDENYRAAKTEEIGDLMTQISSEFDNVLSSFFTRQLSNDILPRMNFEDRDDSYVLDFEIPGAEEEDININLKEDYIEIKADVKKEHKETDKGKSYVERRYGTFYRAVEVPEDVDTGNITATYKNGILKIVLPKSPEKVKNTKKIELSKK
jgi:HSP20 family protein